MNRLLTWAMPLALALAPVPALAQDDVPDLSGLGALTEMFVAEPLTPEQQARMPLATALVEKVMPPGSMREAMGEMFDSILSPMAQAAEADARSVITRRIPLLGEAADLTDTQAAQVAMMLDPAWEERERRERELMPQIMAGVMDVMEPPMRQAMAELYAINFTEAELADIDAFFATPTGAAYARKSYTMASDPRIAAASMSVLPAMMAGFADMEAEMAAATADLPAERYWDDLTTTERKQLARLLGMSEEDLQYTLVNFDEDSLDAEY